MFGAAFQAILAALDRFEIPYAVGGSLASSVHGNFRLTNDIDILVDMPPGAADEFADHLKRTFIVDAEDMRNAFLRGRPYNIIHRQDALKFDLFPAGSNEFERSELSRRRFAESRAFGEAIEFAVLTPEDVLLAKLRWYRAGSESSEQQWRDVAGIVDVRGPQLDRAYLKHWAKELGVEDLLARLLR